MGEIKIRLMNIITDNKKHHLGELAYQPITGAVKDAVNYSPESKNCSAFLVLSSLTFTEHTNLKNADFYFVALWKKSCFG